MEAAACLAQSELTYSSRAISRGRRRVETAAMTAGLVESRVFSTPMRLALAALVSIVLTNVEAVVAAGSAESAAARKSCDDILVGHGFYSVAVRRGHAYCVTARRVLSELFAGGGVKHGGPYAYEQWWSIGDWRCGFGAGGAGCSRKASNKHPSASILATWLAWECGYKPRGATAPCAATPHDALRAVRRARLRSVPLWPTYLPSRVRDGTWYVSDLRGVQRYPRYPDKTASGRNAFRIDYGYNVQPQFFGGGAFSRTSAKALLPAIRASRRNYVPRHLVLGGRKVVQFRLGGTATEWAFAGPGGYYVFSSKDFGGPSRRVIGRIIATLRPANRLPR